MRKLLFVVSFLISFTAFGQTNVGFAKAAALQEAVACSSQSEVLTRFIAGLENKIIAPFFSERISQSWVNAEKKLKSRVPTLQDFIQILKYVREYPESMAEYGVSVYKLPAGSYTFETLSFRDGGWIKGKEITRTAHEGEYVLEWWGQKVASSWCLNLFASVGEIQQKFGKVEKPEEVFQVEVDTRQEKTCSNCGERRVLGVMPETEFMVYICFWQKYYDPSMLRYVTQQEAQVAISSSGRCSGWRICTDADLAHFGVHKPAYQNQIVAEQQARRRGYR